MFKTRIRSPQVRQIFSPPLHFSSRVVNYVNLSPTHDSLGLNLFLIKQPSLMSRDSKVNTPRGSEIIFKHDDRDGVTKV